MQLSKNSVRQFDARPHGSCHRPVFIRLPDEALKRASQGALSFESALASPLPMFVVELKGVEPSTSGLQSRRSPN